MKANISTYPTALRLLAALFFFLLFTLPAAGEEGSAKKWDGSVATALKFGRSDGVKGNPIKISTPEELAYFAQQVNAGASLYGMDGSNSFVLSNDNGFSGNYFELSADIDLAGEKWTPIGTGRKSFRGHFDGQGHVVKGLKVDINGSGEICGGLFGRVSDGTIQNLGVELSKDGIKASSYGSVFAGGIVGYITGSDAAATIRNCYVTGSGGVKVTGYNVSEYAYAGGIAGFVNQAGGGGNQSVTLTHCYVTVDVDVDGFGTYIGGIVGKLSGGTLSFTYATGTVTGKDGSTGGICGYSSGGSLTNNLALNEKISGGSRVLGGNSSKTLDSNYANPDMLVNGQLAAGTDAGSNSGAATYSDKFKDDLIGTTPDETAWNTAWTWTDGKLPQLKMITGEDTDGTPTGYSENAFGSQPSISVGDYLPHAPWADCAATSIVNSGTGTKDNPILIATPQELAYLAQQVNKNEKLMVSNSSIEIKNENGFSGKYFELSATIDLAGGEWTPIGNAPDRYFSGHFDGMGYTVKGLKISMNVEGADTGWTLAGLFGYVKNGTLQNLGVELADAGIQVKAGKGDVLAGGIAGRFEVNGQGQTAILRNCYITGNGAVTITTGAGGDAYAGGIIGSTFFYSGTGSISHCYSLVDVKASAANGYAYAGGIGGRMGIEVSYTYATGKIEATGNSYVCAGGICGRSKVSNSLALNESIKGNSANRIAETSSTLANNYASTRTMVNGRTVSSSDNPSSEKGADTWLDTFENDLKGVSDEAEAAWNAAWTWPGGKLSQLLMITGEDAAGTPTSYDTWSPGIQPSIDAADLLPVHPKLHIVQPAKGGKLQVFDEATGLEIFNGEAVTPGITLSLGHAADNNYRFDGFYSGTTADDITTPVSGTTIQMPAADLWLSARFTYVAPAPDPEPEPEPTVYYTVTLPEVEGATTDPVAGSYEVEAWSTFRFYLTTDTAYSESQPVVTTDRGETLTPRSSDGAYLVKYVRSDVDVFIDGLFPNNPVANESITDPHATSASALPRIWTEPSVLCILFPDGFSATPVRILSPDGRLLATFQSAPGLSRRQLLPTGIYIVWIGNTVRKVVVRN